MAEFERESIRTRMREASGERLRRGIKHCVRLPFAYKLGAGNRLVPNDAEQRVIAEMRHLRGGTKPTSFARIADTLTPAPFARAPAASGTPPPCGTCSRPRSRPAPPPSVRS